ncbi:MAG: galactokinase [Clostridiales bacterium]|nr:galactokinase [Clostridiales bacterium]
MNLLQLENKLIEIYGKSNEQIRFFRSPGRVNLIGEHIDYNGGSVFPAALTLASTVAIRKRNDNIIRLYATDLNYVVEAKLDCLELYKAYEWGNYQLGVLDELQKAGYSLTGCEMIFDDKVPLGSGLSSSAAIEVVTAIALLAINNHFVDLVEIVKLCVAAEHNYVGVKCGIMDQFASAMGKANHALLLDCKTLDYAHIPLEMDGIKIVISNTNKKRSLGESKYNERFSQCQTALSFLQADYSAAEYLCDLSYSQLLNSSHLITDSDILNRATHVIKENERVKLSVKALQDGNVEQFGKYMNESHNSLRDLYEVSCIELDTLVNASLLQTGVLGSRMTGAGFGGCTVSLVKEKYVDKFIKNVGKIYNKAIGYEATFYISEIGDGGKEVYKQ